LDPLTQALKGILPPLALAVPILAAAWRPFGRRPIEDSAVTRGAAPAAIGLGYLAGHVALTGWPPLAWDVELKHGLFYLCLLATLLGLLEARGARPARVGQLILSVLVPVYLLDFVRAHRWTTTESVLWSTGLALAILAGAASAEALARRREGVSIPLAWTVVGTGAATALHLSGSTSLGQLMGAWTSVLGACVVLAVLRPRFRLAPGALTILVLLAGGLLGGLFASELRPISAILLFLAVFGPWLGELPRLRDRSGPVGLLTRLLPVLLLSGAAVWIEVVSRPADPYADAR